MKCKNCNEEVVGKGVGNGKFCNERCKYTWHNHHRTLKPNVSYNCIVCGKKVTKYVEPSKIGVSATLQFCNRTCKGIYQTGDKHPRWNGGRQVDAGGYVYVHAKDHPNADHHKMILEHRLIMEKKIGRYLKKEEVVHHKNGINSDNRISNLILFENQSEHKKHHEPNRTKNKENGRYLPLRKGNK
jgi:hypothetical protein